MDKPWLKRKFKDRTEFLMPVNYIIEHLGEPAASEVKGVSVPEHYEKYRHEKEKDINKILDDGLEPLTFDPILLELSRKEEKFYITDGFSRLRAFYKRKIPNIRVLLGYAFK